MESDSDKSLFALLYDNVSDGVVVTDTQGKIQYANKVIYALTDPACMQPGTDISIFFTHHGIISEGVFDPDIQENTSRLYPADFVIHGNVYKLAISSLQLNGNSIRIYTLHVPDYSNALRSYILHHREFYEFIAASLHEVVYYFDYLSNTYLYMSRNIEDLIGYSVDEVNTMGMHKLIKKIEKVGGADLAKNLQQVHPQAGSVIVNEYLMRTRDGGTRWCEEKGCKIKDQQGRLIGQFGTLRDISKEKSIFSALRDTEFNLKSLLDYTPIGMAVMQDARLVYANSEMLRILRTGSSQLHEKNVEDFIRPEAVEPFWVLIKNVQQKNETLSEYLFELINAEGEHVSVQGSLIPIQYSGTPALQVILKDMSEQKKLDQARLATLRIAEATEQITDLAELCQFIHTTLADFIPIRNFYMAFIEKSGTEITFPYYVDEFDEPPVGASPITGLTGYVIQEKRSVLLTHEQYEVIHEHGDVEVVGEPAAVWLGVPLKIRNEVIGVLVVQDYQNPETYGDREKELLETISYSLSYVVERKRIEIERVELISKLKELNASKDSLFSVISHDLRSPFNSILGFVNILESDYAELSVEEALDILGSLKNVTQKVLNMLHNLLEYSRFQLGHIEYHPEKTNLKAAVLYIVQLLKGNLEKKSITLNVDVNDELFVFADEKMLVSVLQNLITNAIKFSAHNSVITVSAQSAEDHFAAISVRDQGVGMNSEQLENLFKIEHIKSTFGTDNEAGSGLGLILVRDFVRQQGGTISVESEKNNGAVFTFTIPLWGN
ncbi:MAG: PAS domain S-box protein [Ignavibacteria bacterium]|nr:PAS domain S-box protein [Ignavibacteria bacterium]